MPLEAILKVIWCRISGWRSNNVILANDMDFAKGWGTSTADIVRTVTTSGPPPINNESVFLNKSSQSMGVDQWKIITSVLV